MGHRQPDEEQNGDDALILRDLLFMSGETIEGKRFAERSAFSRYVLDRLQVAQEVDPKLLEGVVRSVLEAVAERVRKNAFMDLRMNEGEKPSRAVSSFRAAASAEFLGFKGDEENIEFHAFRELWRGHAGLKWDEASAKERNQYPSRQRRLRAGAWVGLSGELAYQERLTYFPAFLRSIEEYFADDRVRASLRVTLLSQTAATDVVSRPIKTVHSRDMPTASNGEQQVTLQTIESKLLRTAQALARVVLRRLNEDRSWHEIDDRLVIQFDNADESHLFDRWENVCRSTGRSELIQLNGTLDNISDVFRLVPSRRLVILGKGGAGKTTLINKMAHDFLSADGLTADSPVPVQLSLSKWVPTDDQLLRDWIIESLLKTYAVFGKRKKKSQDLALQLLETRLLLPVLDGFDEIAPAVRVDALRKISTYSGPIVVTSRLKEYEYAVENSGSVVSDAAGIQVQDLTLDDVKTYLRLNSRKVVGKGDWSEWEELFSVLESPDSDPDAVARVRSALSTPLMVSLASSTYKFATTKPTELFDTKAFPSAASITDYLIDHFVRVAYERPPRSNTSKRKKDRNSEDIARWLGFLSAQAHARGTVDIAWWHIGILSTRANLWLWFGILLPAAGLLFAGIARESSLLPSILIGLVLAGSISIGMILVQAYAFDDGQTKPIRLSWGRSSDARTNTPTAIFGASGALFCLLALIVAEPKFEMQGPASPSFLISFMLIFLLAPLPLLISASNAIHSASPVSLLQADRIASGALAVLHFLSWSTILFVYSRLERYGAWFPEILLITMAMLPVSMGTSASGQWYVRTAFLALNRNLRFPFGAMKFLEDAYDRGILRQSGGVYQFRHALVQDRLSFNFVHSDLNRLTKNTAISRARTYIAVARFSSGSFDTADDELRKVIELQSKRFLPQGRIAILARILLTQVLLKKGEIETAIRELRTLMSSRAYKNLKSRFDLSSQVRGFVNELRFAYNDDWKTLATLLEGTVTLLKERLSDDHADVVWFDKEISTLLAMIERYNREVPGMW